MEEENDYNFLERLKDFGDAVTTQVNLTPNQTIQNFFGDGNIIEAYKNKTIGKEYIDNEINKLTAAWNLLPDGGKQAVMTGLQAVGDTYQDFRTVEGREKFDPRAWILAGGLRGLEGVGWATDKVIGKPTSYAAHNWLGIDKRGADALGFAADVVLGDKALSKLGKLKHLSKLNRLNKGKKVNYAKIIDEVNSYSPTTLAHSKRLIQFDPEINLDPFLFDEVRNAEKALKARGKTPNTENIYNYLNEYKTDFTVQPKTEWYNKNFKKTTVHDLSLYSKSPKDFKVYPTFEDALNAAEVDLLTTKLGTKKRWQGIDAKIYHTDEYVKFFGTKDEGIKVLPYNKWHQIKKNPFKVPKDVVNKLKKMESRQIDLIDDKPPTVEKVTKKGKVIDTPAKIKYDKGTVDEFVKYVDDEIAWQTEQQRLDEDFAKALYKDLGIRYRRGKTVFSRDKSHAVARSEGGPGYTFLEAWWSNQQRGSKEILKPEILSELGIPRTWEEYFYRWYQQKGQPKPMTDLGKLADISWDDYERAMNGVSVNTIKLDRRTINHLIQRQIADPTTFNKPGNIGATIGEDFDILVKRTKGLSPQDELLGEINPKEFDLRWRANTYQMGVDAKGQFLKEKYKEKVYQRAHRQNVKEQKQSQKKVSRETKRLEKKGQGKLFEFLNDLFPDR